MSGHSKFSKIKHQKGSADQKRGALFSKISRNITAAARGGSDPNANFKLRLIIDKARSAGMTKETIDRAIAKGSGTDKEATILIEETYEGFGPGKTAYIVEVIANNKNRIYQELRRAFSDHGGVLGNSGSVNWMFEHKGVIHLDSSLRDGAPSLSDEQLELQLIDAGADDLEQNEDEIIVYTKLTDLKQVEENIRAQGIKIEYAGLEWVAKETINPDEELQAKLETFENTLDELEDVSEYYSNVN